MNTKTALRTAALFTLAGGIAACAGGEAPRGPLSEPYVKEANRSPAVGNYRFSDGTPGNYRSVGDTYITPPTQSPNQVTGVINCMAMPQGKPIAIKGPDGYYKIQGLTDQVLHTTYVAFEAKTGTIIGSCPSSSFVSRAIDAATLSIADATMECWYFDTNRKNPSGSTPIMLNRMTGEIRIVTPQDARYIGKSICGKFANPPRARRTTSLELPAPISTAPKPIFA